MDIFVQSHITTLLLGIQDDEVTGVAEERSSITIDCKPVHDRVCRRKHVFLRVRKTRYNCKDCGVRFEAPCQGQADDEAFNCLCGGSKYQTILADGEGKEIVDILPTRYNKDLDAYFSSIDRKERQGVEIFVNDMCGSFKGVKENFFPKSTHVIDRYHFIRQVHWALEFDEITNSFNYPWNNGFVEGTHNKIKTVKRVTFGMRNFHHFRTKLLLVCAKDQ